MQSFGLHPVARVSWQDEPVVPHESVPIPSIGLVEQASGIGKGLGLYAQKSWPAFKCLLVDEALISLKEGEDLMELFQKYELLPESHRKMFDSLCSREDPQADARLSTKLAQRGFSMDASVHQMISVSNKFLANAFNFADQLEAQGNYRGNAPIFRRALFPKIARINHSCTPNAHVHYRREIGSMLVYALRDIQQGEEISIAYFNVTMSRDQRQMRAKDWGFSCACVACVSQDDLIQHENFLAVVRGAMKVNANVLLVNAAQLDSKAFRARIDSTQDIIKKIRHTSFLLPQLPELYEQLALLQTRAEIFKDGVVPRSSDKVQSYQLALAASINISGPDSPSSRRREELLKSVQT